MSRKSLLTDRVRTLQLIEAAVVAMKSLSAHHFRLTRAALVSVRAYRVELEHTVAGIVPPVLEADAGPPLLIVIGAVFVPSTTRSSSKPRANTHVSSDQNLSTASVEGPPPFSHEGRSRCGRRTLRRHPSMM
jgi:hypothetical protein